MLYSMTGFGRGESECSVGSVIVEVKTVNSKNLDLSSLKLPTRYREFEMMIRGKLSRAIGRGKVDCSVYFQWNEDFSPSITLMNAKAVQDAYADMVEMSGTLSMPIERGVLAQLAFQLPLSWSTVEAPLHGDERDCLLSALDKALEELIAFRKSEGQATYNDLLVQVREIRSRLDLINVVKDERIEHLKSRLLDALGRLLDPLNGQLDEQRFSQELLYHIERLDINEEIKRLSQHCTYFLNTMEGHAEQGRKLAFIAQEMGREINTIGSKSNYVSMQHYVVEMKDHLEQIKEQVMNVL